MIEIVLTFEHTYEVSLFDWLPTGTKELPVFYLPSGSREGGKDGLIVSVRPHLGGQPWVGVFAFGFPGFPAWSGLYSCPNSSLLCVVSKGKAYLIAADDPSHCTFVPSQPVREVMPLRRSDLLLFTDNTTVTAVGKDGVVWKTERLVVDDLKFVLSDESVELFTVSGWDPLNSERVELKIDVAVGRIAS